MKNVIKLITILLFMILLSSCMTQRVVTPPDKAIQLATSEDNCTLTSEKTDWYYAWGTVTPDHNSTIEMLTDVNKPVIIKIGSWSDYLLGFSTLGLAVPQTVRVYECEK